MTGTAINQIITSQSAEELTPPQTAPGSVLKNAKRVQKKNKQGIRLQRGVFSTEGLCQRGSGIQVFFSDTFSYRIAASFKTTTVAFTQALQPRECLNMHLHHLYLRRQTSESVWDNVWLSQTVNGEAQCHIRYERGQTMVVSSYCFPLFC